VPIKISVWHDEDAMDPCDFGLWKVFSFSRRHYNFKNPDDIDLKKTEPKLKDGRAFWLDCYQHGCCTWSLHGEGTQCQFDTAKKGGILFLLDQEFVLEEDRKERACEFLNMYSQWCNGECYGWSVEDENGDVIDSCGGYIGMDDLIEGIRESYGDEPFEIITERTETVTVHDQLGEWVAERIKEDKR